MRFFSYLCTRYMPDGFMTERSFAPVAELVDAPDLGSGVSRRAGSSPVRRTMQNNRQNGCQIYHKYAILVENCSFL